MEDFLMNYSRNFIDELGKETKFIKANLEKVLRLLDVLNFLFQKSEFKDKLVLKGGTAINLVFTKLKRLSVDIDLDYQGSLDKEIASQDREKLLKELDDFMISQGYEVNRNNRSSFILSSKDYRYTNAFGNVDYIYVEINFIDRIHLLPAEKHIINYFNKEVTLLVPSKEELFGMKISALLNRTKPRDLYDSLFIMNNADSFDINLLKKCALFYLSLDCEFDINSIIHNISNISFYSIKTELYPVISMNEKFDLEKCKAELIGFLNKVFDLTKAEIDYLEEFSKGNFKPNLLFDKEISDRASQHPMAKWRILNINK